MIDYRLYRCDGSGKIRSAEWLAALDDEAVVAQARGLSAGVILEIWERQRFVARLDAEGNRAD